MRTLLAVLAVFSLGAISVATVSTVLAEDQPSGPLVVVDPGHGGANLGAPTVGVRNEKHFTLEVSNRLAAELRARGARVVLTRTTDTYMTLRQRSLVANGIGADMFISIHGNASPDHSRSGFETFFLSPKALDVDARALRTIGPQRAGLSKSISRLVDDVERGLAHPRSAELATAVQNAIAKVRPNSPNRGVKQESMHVLLGAHMPAVLVELGFIDHPREGPELLQPATQTALAKSIADAIVGGGE